MNAAKDNGYAFSDKKYIYEKALEICRKYSAMPLTDYYDYNEGLTIHKGIGGIDSFHLAYAKYRDKTGKILSKLVTRDKALLIAAAKENQPTQSGQ